ncbi:phage tail protein [Pseudovibrio ascidiaceicola]|uniref:phage tail protein n=1 Tax=Pseudovibrio ascidiaceicola TaxID=285279 RepID=UPI003D35A7AE
MARTMMALGAFRFGLRHNAYSSLQQDWQFKFGDVQRLGNRAATHFTGWDPEPITIQGTVYTMSQGNLGQIQQMAEYGKTGKPLIMVDGTGFSYGKVVIRSLQEGKRYFFPNGSPRAIDFTIEVTQYG